MTTTLTIKLVVFLQEMAALFSEIAQSQSCSGKQLEILPDSSEMENVKPSLLAAVVKTLVGFSSPLHCLTASQLDCVFNNVSNTTDLQLGAVQILRKHKIRSG